MHLLNIRLGLLACGLIVAPFGHAASANDVLGVSLTLVENCQTRSVADANAVDFGNPRFGDSDSPVSLTNTAASAGDGAAVSIRCSYGSYPAVSLLAGANDGKAPGGTRAMVNAAGDLVAYDLYADAGRTRPLAIDEVIALIPGVDIDHSVWLYGKTVDGLGTRGGGYFDTVTVQLTF